MTGLHPKAIGSFDNRYRRWIERGWVSWLGNIEYSQKGTPWP